IGTLLRQLAPNGVAKHDQALADIERFGGGDFFVNGKFAGVTQALGILNRFYKATDQNVPLQTATAKNALLVQGAQAAAVLSNDTSIKQYSALLASISSYTPAKVQDIQGQLNATLPGQLKTLNTNLQSISAMLGKELLPTVLKLTNAFVTLTGGIIKFGETHPKMVALGAILLEIATAVGLILGPLIIASAAWGALAGIAAPVIAGLTGIGTALWLTAAGLFGVDLLLAPIALGVLAVVAVVGTAVYAFTHWSDISKTLGTVFGWLGDKLHGFLVYLGLAHDGPREKAQSTVGPNAGDTAVVDGHTYRRTVGYRGIGGVVDEGPAGPRKYGPPLPPGYHFPAHHQAPPPTFGPPLPKGYHFPKHHAPPTIHIHPGAVVVHGAPGQDEATLAQRVYEILLSKLGTDQMWQSSQPYGYEPGYFGV